MELWVFLGAGFVLLILLARRNRAFGRRHHGDPDGRGAFPQVGAGAGRAQFQARDPRAQLDAGDRLGRR